MLGTARGITGLVYSGTVERKWDEEKTESAMFMDKMQQHNKKKCDAECCAQTSGEVSSPAAKLRADPSLLNPPSSTSPRDPCSRRVPSWEQPTSPPEILGRSLEGDPGLCCHPSACCCKRSCAGGECAGEEGDSSWEPVCRGNPIMCAIDRD